MRKPNFRRKKHGPRKGNKLVPSWRASGFKSPLEWKVSVALKATYPSVSYEPVRLTYSKEHTYTPDFLCASPSGGMGYERPFMMGPDTYFEAKGRFTSADRTKMIAVKRAHPEKDIRIVFSRNNFLYKGSKTRYLDWAKEHGFPASIYPELPL